MAVLHASQDGQSLLRAAGLDGDTVWNDPRIRVWRDIPERQNCLLDVDFPDGQTTRLHVKRFHPGYDRPVQAEVHGIQLLHQAGIPTVPLVGWSEEEDGSGVVITEDLRDYQPGDKSTHPVTQLIEPLARLTAQLHAAGLHHRDLYLCHFFVSNDDPQDVRLIDAARVKPLPRWPLRTRWIVKDLAQLWYSLDEQGVDEIVQEELLARYACYTGGRAVEPLRRRILAKSRRIARHDARLRNRQPARNISIPV